MKNESDGAEKSLDGYFKTISSTLALIDKIEAAQSGLADSGIIDVDSLLELAESHPEILAATDDLSELQNVLAALRDTE